MKDLYERFWEKVVVGPECWGWSAHKHKLGYGKIRPTSKYCDAMIGAHQASWMIHKGPIPEGMCVLHKCDNPECSNPSHLFLGSHTDNMRDKERKRRGKHPRKLSESDVAEIQTLFLNGHKQALVAEKFGVSFQRISQLKKEAHH